MKIPWMAAAAASLVISMPPAEATVIDSAYRSLGGNAWLVGFTIVNDGTPANFAGFSIDFPNATNLALVATPSAWNSTVFQQDASLPDDAFLDSFAANPSNIWAAGSSIGGFEVSFRYTAGAAPGALPFMLYSDTFVPLFSGTTTVTAVPEPATGLLLALGLTALAWRSRHRATAASPACEEPTA